MKNGGVFRLFPSKPVVTGEDFKGLIGKGRK